LQYAKQKFSDRLGITKHNPIQIDSMDENLRNSLWNVILNAVFSGDAERFRRRVEFIFNHFLKLPEDDLPYGNTRNNLKQISFMMIFTGGKFTTSKNLSLKI
jgi:hypothetical protein